MRREERGEWKAWKAMYDWLKDHGALIHITQQSPFTLHGTSCSKHRTTGQSSQYA